MVNYLEHKEINKQKWDACVQQSSQEMPYALSWYLDVVCEKWDGLVLNDYQAVMPLPFKNKWGVKIIYQPFFTQQLGVFGRGEVIAFLEAIPNKFKHIQYNFNCENNTLKQGNEQRNLVLSLQELYEEIHKKFGDNHRRNIKKANHQKLVIAPCEVTELITMFRHSRGEEIKHLKEKNYTTLHKLITVFLEKKCADILGIYTIERELLGGAVILNYQSRKIFFFSALNKEGKEKAGMHFLINHLILTNSSSSFILDFEGSMNDGLYRFYKGFGAIEQNYFSYVNNQLPFPHRFFKG